MNYHASRATGAIAPLPARAGVSLKPEHYETILRERPNVGWFEVHPENYMGAGGPPHYFLERIRADYAISMHGVGLSIGGALPIDEQHLERLLVLVDRYQPAQVSEHLAWSTHDGCFMNDLLPLPYTNETLTIVCAHIDQVQRKLGRSILIENPSTYVAFPQNDFSETEFLTEITKRTGCGLLLDVNNVFVQCTNRGWNAIDYLDGFPLGPVGEIHLAGHNTDTGDDGEPLLIDSHDRPVIDAVWALFQRVVERTGAMPTLIEWDDRIPAWPVLEAEGRKADALLARCAPHRGALEGNRHALA